MAPHENQPPEPTSDTSQLDDDLVAYLDGELDPEEMRRVDELVARDEQARTRLRALERAWDALDELPRTTVDQSFTRSTVEMIALTAGSEADEIEAELPRRRRARWLVGTGATALAALAGFLGVHYAWPDPNRQIVEDLPVLEQMDAYRQVQDIDFLRRLADEKLFAEDSRGR